MVVGVAAVSLSGTAARLKTSFTDTRNEDLTVPEIAVMVATPQLPAWIDTVAGVVEVPSVFPVIFAIDASDVCQRSILLVSRFLS